LSLIELHVVSKQHKRGTTVSDPMTPHGHATVLSKNFETFAKVRKNKTQKANCEEQIDEPFSFFEAQEKVRN
jgi:hypothetical protein